MFSEQFGRQIQMQGGQWRGADGAPPQQAFATRRGESD
jgi:hypothetical protein